jgi:RNA polymerase sigma-70 factor (ECF subfamily)
VIDTDEFDALFNEHVKAVYAYARRRIDVADVDDVVTETFTVAWRQLATLPARPLPYLLGIARKVIANRRRANRRRTALVDKLGVHSASNTSDTGEDALEARRVLGLLPDVEREALLLIAWDGLTPDDAALVLGCTRNAVDLRVFRARRRINELIQTTQEVRP